MSVAERNPERARPAPSAAEASGASPEDPIPADLLAEFQAATRRDLRTRFRYSFIRTRKPVMDDARFRAFTSMKEYRDWCEANLPSWLGYGRPTDSE